MQDSKAAAVNMRGSITMMLWAPDCRYLFCRKCCQSRSREPYAWGGNKYRFIVRSENVRFHLHDKSAHFNEEQVVTSWDADTVQIRSSNADGFDVSYYANPNLILALWSHVSRRQCRLRLIQDCWSLISFGDWFSKPYSSIGFWD